MENDKISLIVIAKNAEDTIANCLTSAKDLVSEIILVDDCSTDETVQRAQKLGAKVFTKKLESFSEQKQFALDQASNYWALLLDSDETISSHMKDEIHAALSSKLPCEAYRIPRRNHYFGRWLKFGGKYPDYQIRFFKRGSVQFSGNIIHEKLLVNGRTGVFRSWIKHDSYPDIRTWIEKLGLYARFRADEMDRGGIVPSYVNAFRFCLFRPLWRFVRRFILKLGFLDGLPGFLACLHDALTEILTYTQLVQKREQTQLHKS